MKTCERIFASPDAPQRVCGKPAEYEAYGDTYFCGDCLHDCMEDASPEEQETVKKLEVNV